ncbi:hypothetical protein BpHYR1_014899 [Brachionus plicatilis]|uniref:Uncharacterized protein n=1 Tax=Brachionus plicatilis TaxID=10195 RepID=A0A3M7R9J3_BRAPC|nr:hypothetical protein BpHYR1_014899 [Brachionus plicatilis]
MVKSKFINFKNLINKCFMMKHILLYLNEQIEKEFTFKISIKNLKITLPSVLTKIMYLTVIENKIKISSNHSQSDLTKTIEQTFEEIKWRNKLKL